MDMLKIVMPILAFIMPKAMAMALPKTGKKAKSPNHAPERWNLLLPLMKSFALSNCSGFTCSQCTAHCAPAKRPTK